jgi:cytochrome P450
MSGTAFDPFGGPMLADPYPDFARLVADRPVFWAPELGYWVVSRHADCRQVLRDHETFSASNTLSPVLPPCPAAGAALAAGGFRSVPTLTNVDPPAHTRTRRIAHLAFTPRRVAQRETFVRDLVRRFIASQPADGTVDIVRALTYELPALVVFDVLGVPPSDVDAIKEGSANRLLFMFGRSDEATQVRTAEGMAAFWRYCESLAEDRRAHPRDDFTSDLVHHPDEAGQPLTQQEVSTILFGLLLAGHETTTNILGNGLRRLLSHRQAWEAICADPSLVPNAVEEILRFDSSVPTWRRVTTRATTLGGVELPQGAKLLVGLGSANHDDSHFRDGERFDVRRENAKDQLAFSWGRHTCLGARLARMEMRVFLEQITKRLPHMELVPGQTFAYSPNTSHRGPEHVLVRWDPALNPLETDRPSQVA